MPPTGYLTAAGDLENALLLYTPVVKALEHQILPPHAVSGASVLAASNAAAAAEDVDLAGRWLALALELSDAEGDMQVHCMVQLALLRMQLKGPKQPGAAQLHLRPPAENSLLTLELWEKVIDLLEPWQEAALIIDFAMVVAGTNHQVCHRMMVNTMMMVNHDGRVVNTPCYV